MTPYFCTTWEMTLATPELTPPIRKAAPSTVIIRSATREPVAGVVSVSTWTVSILPPSTPPLAFCSAIAIRMPRRSLLGDRHQDAAALQAAGIAVLAAIVRGQTDHQRPVGGVGDRPAERQQGRKAQHPHGLSGHACYPLIEVAQRATMRIRFSVSYALINKGTSLSPKPRLLAWTKFWWAASAIGETRGTCSA